MLSQMAWDMGIRRSLIHNNNSSLNTRPDPFIFIFLLSRSGFFLCVNLQPCVLCLCQSLKILLLWDWRSSENAFLLALGKQWIEWWEISVWSVSIGFASVSFFNARLTFLFNYRGLGVGAGVVTWSSLEWLTQQCPPCGKWPPSKMFARCFRWLITWNFLF